jgi:hypothetical protein
LAQRLRAQIQAIDRACFQELQLATEATVHADHFHFDGVDYFRGHAAAVQLGDVGEKKRSADGHSHLAVQTALPSDKLAIERVTRIDLQRVAVRGSDIQVDLIVTEVGSLGASTVARLLGDKTLCLVKLEAVPRDLIAAANASAGVLNVLSRAGKGGRLVHQVFVVLQTATAQDLSRATRWSLSGARNDCVLTGIGDDGQRSVVVLAPGTTFAYLLLRPTRHDKRIAGAASDSWSRP